MIVHEFLEKHAIVIVEIGDSAGAPLHMLMPNGHPELDRDSFFLEQMFAIDALEQVHVWSRQIAFYGKCLNPIDADVIRNSKVLAYVHIVLLMCLKEKHTRFASPLARGE